MTVRANYSVGERPSVADMNTFAANPALQYITQVNINAVTTTVSNVFSSTYDNYRLEWSYVYTTSGASNFPLISFTNGTGTAHFDGIKTTNSAGTNTFNNQNGSAYWITAYIGNSFTNGSHITMDVHAPFLTVDTTYSSKFTFNNGTGTAGGGFAGGVVRSATSYTGFTIVGLFGFNVTGTLRIYGYRKS
jgi:hypothetical protein